MPSVSPLFEDPAGPGVHDEDHQPVVLGPPGDEVDRATVDGLAETGVEVIARGARRDEVENLREGRQAAIADGVERPVLVGTTDWPLGVRREPHRQQDAGRKEKKEDSPVHDHVLHDPG